MKRIDLLVPSHYPLLCQWEITCRCNLRCVMCYTDCYNTPARIKDELSTVDILRIMDEVAEAGCLELTLTGGEPLARPDFFEIYEHAKARGFLVCVFTNGTLITEAVADRFAADPPARVEISVHGANAESFDAITQRHGSHVRCQAAIRLLLDRHIPLVLKTTAMTVNQAEVLSIKRFAETLGSVSYRLGETMREALDGSEAPCRYQLSAAELDQLERQDVTLSREAAENDARGRPACASERTTCHIDAYGQLQRCSGNRLASYDLRLGSFQEGFRKLTGFPCPARCPETTGREACATT